VRMHILSKKLQTICTRKKSYSAKINNMKKTDTIKHEKYHFDTIVYDWGDTDQTRKFWAPDLLVELSGFSKCDVIAPPPARLVWEGEGWGGGGFGTSSITPEVRAPSHASLPAAWAL